MPNKNGLELIKPTSIASTGTGNSSSINTNGSVTFSSCASLSLNGVFSSTYDNYMVVMRFSATAGDTGASIAHRLRASGTDETGSNYPNQYIYPSGTSVTANRATYSFFYATYTDSASYSSSRSGEVAYIYGPFLSQPTAFRSITISPYLGNPDFWDVAGTHSLSSSYDGLTFTTTGSSRFGGLVAVYGMRN